MCVFLFFFVCVCVFLSVGIIAVIGKDGYDVIANRTDNFRGTEEMGIQRKCAEIRL